jgi:hypothetical protein
MSKNYYSKYNFKELADVYTTTFANYGKINDELLEEINNRGGEIKFKEQLENEKRLHKERQRIINETTELITPETDLDFVKKLISSELISKSEVDTIVESAATSTIKYQSNKAITSKTIAGCIIGGGMGYLLGLGLLILEAIFLKDVFYISLILIYVIAYFLIRLITKQNASNIIVFISALLTTILSFATFLFLNST